MIRLETMLLTRTSIRIVIDSDRQGVTGKLTVALSLSVDSKLN